MCFSYNWRYQDFELVVNLKPLLLFIRKWSITTCSESLHWMMMARPSKPAGSRLMRAASIRGNWRSMREVNDHQWPAMTPYSWYHERYSALVLVVSRSCMSQRKASAVGKDGWLLIIFVIFSLNHVYMLSFFAFHQVCCEKKKTMNHQIQGSPCSVMVDSSSRKAAQLWCR